MREVFVRFTRDRGTNFALDTSIDKHDAREREGNRRNYSLYDDKAGRGNKYVHGPQGLSRSLTVLFLYMTNIQECCFAQQLTVPG